MAFYDKFPYTNFQELNLDRIVEKIGDIDRAEEATEASAQAAKESENAAANSATESALSANNASNSAAAAQRNADSLAGVMGQVSINTERINNILVEGTPTEGNAELIDIRAGANGITYPTAGDAVRGQYSELNNLAETLLEDAVNPITATAPGVYNINTNVIETPLSSTRHIEYDVTPGDLAIIYGFFYNQNYPVYTFFNAGGVVIAHSTGETSGINRFSVIVPENAAKIIINCSTNNTEYQKLYTSGLFKEQFNATINPIATAFETSVESFGYIEPGCYNITTEEIVSPLASTRHIEVPVTEGQRWYVAGYYYNASFPLWVMFNSSGTRVKISTWATSGAAHDTVDIPSGVTKLIVNCSTNTTENYAKTSRGVAPIGEVSSLNGKRMLWLGTSIPAGGTGDGVGTTLNYPIIVGQKTGASVINKAIGESSVHAKLIQRVNEFNPYGFVSNWEKAARCLTNTVAEVNWLINNVGAQDADGNYIFTNRPETIDDNRKEFYRNCSYERVIDTQSNIDIYVFDHGHNDNSYNENVVNGQVKTDEEMRALYGQNNLYTWEGACNFIFSHILALNNKARIIMIGELDNRLAHVPEYQMKVATSWEIPIYKQWEVLGWNVNNTFTTTGYWNNTTGMWIESGGPSRQITTHSRFIRDDIHPSSDASGYAVKYMANHMSKWLVVNSPID